MRTRLFTTIVLVVLPLLVATGCQPMLLTPTPQAELIPPKVELERVEIAHYWPFFLDTENRRGSPLELAFIYRVENPNSVDVMLDSVTFTVAFAPGFEVNTVNTYEDMWIPPFKANELRVNVTLDAFTTLLSLLVTSGHQLEEMGVTAPEQLKTWWEGIQDFAFDIEVRGGKAQFRSSLGDVIVPFEATFP